MKLPGYGGALLMILPPGGFCRAGFILAGKRAMELRQARLAKGRPPPAAQPSHCQERLTKPSWRCCPTVVLSAVVRLARIASLGFCEPL